MSTCRKWSDFLSTSSYSCRTSLPKVAPKRPKSWNLSFFHEKSKIQWTSTRWKFYFSWKQLLKHSAIDLSRGVRAENAQIFYHRVRSHGERASQRSLKKNKNTVQMVLFDTQLAGNSELWIVIGKSSTRSTSMIY